MNRIWVFFLFFGLLIFAGCATQSQIQYTCPDGKTVASLSDCHIQENQTQTNPPADASNTPSKPFTDSATIKARVLDVWPQGARLEVLEVLSYSPDPRDGTIKLANGDIRNFTFQWGTSPTVVDMPPIGPSDTDINLIGVIKYSILEANISISGDSWVVYAYE